jgi:hypothetical protein
MNKPPHLLGEKRGFVIIAISVITGLVIFISGLISGKPISENTLKTIQYFVLSLPVAWLLTTEPLLRFFLSSLISFVISAIIGILIFLIWLIFIGSDDMNKAQMFTVSEMLTIPVFLILIFIINNSLGKSNVFGVPCQHCHVRGKLESEEIDKQFLGQKYRNNDLYNIYKITDREWCNACGKDWTSTRETDEPADGSNGVAKGLSNISKLGS